MKKEAFKQSSHTAINWMDRAEIVSILESAGIACYDHEDTENLREALRANVMDGTIPEDELDYSEIPGYREEGQPAPDSEANSSKKTVISESNWRNIGEKMGWIKVAQQLSALDENTRIIGKINSVKQAKELCMQRFNKIPKIGYEMQIDSGISEIRNNPREYRTYLANESGRFRVWTWISVNPPSTSEINENESGPAEDTNEAS